MNIADIIAREVLDSRGQPTVEAEVRLDNGMHAVAMVPSGASTGRREAVELRDHDMSRYRGKGVQKAVSHIQRIIAPRLVGYDVTRQAVIDDMLCDLDGTNNKAHLGANAVLAVSLAVAKASAMFQQIPLHTSFGWREPYRMPLPLVNVINGGAHADNGLSVQEFMIVPLVLDFFSEKLRVVSEIFMSLKALLKKNGMITAVGDEGGFAPQLPSTCAALDCLLEAIDMAGYKPGVDVALALDVASTEIYRNQAYHFAECDKPLDSLQLVDFLEELLRQYPIVSIEDGCAEDDWDGWQLLTERLNGRCQLIGDDLFVTQSQYLEKGFELKAANAILIKPNQVGTLTETLDAIKLAQEKGYGVVLSHRSGETEDSMLADLAVGTSAGQIKTGSVCRSERIAKYNQLLRIEHGSEQKIICDNTLLSCYLHG